MDKQKIHKTVPVYTKDNPLSFEKALEQVAPKIIERIIEIDKEDGTVCMFPFCKSEHDTYRIQYQRTLISKEINP